MNNRKVYKVKMVKDAEMQVYSEAQAEKLSKAKEMVLEEASVKLTKANLKKMQRLVGLQGHYDADVILREFLKLKVQEL